MGVSYNYFKEYKIGPTEDNPYDDVIQYINGDSYGIGFSTSGMLDLILEYCGALIPIYDWSEPPEDKKLELIEPGIVIDACNKALELLEKEKNPQLDYYKDGNCEPLFDEDYLEREPLDEANTRMVRRINEVKELSLEGYYITEKRD